MLIIPGSFSSQPAYTPPLMIDHASSPPSTTITPRITLDSLPPEIHLAIFEYLQGETSLRVPLCRSLRHSQRANLLHNVKIKTWAILVRFIDSLRDNDLGRFVHHLVINNIMAVDVQQKLALLPKLVPQLRSFECRNSSDFMGDVIMTCPEDLPELKELRIMLTLPERVNALLRLKRIEGLRLEFNTGGLPAIGGVVRERCRTLSLTSLVVGLGTADPAVIDLLRSVKCPDITLFASHHPLLPAVNVLCAYATQYLHLSKTSNVDPDYIDTQFNRFINLTELYLGGPGITFSPDFFTSYLQNSSLTNLCLIDFIEFNAQDLIDALTPSTSARHLKVLRLDTIECEGYDEAELMENWTERCNLNHIWQILELARGRDIWTGGGTFNAYRRCMEWTPSEEGSGSEDEGEDPLWSEEWNPDPDEDDMDAYQVSFF